MKTLHTHNEEMEKKLYETYTHLNDSTPEGGYDAMPYVKNFITNQNKQLYIKIAEGELKRLKEMYKDENAREQNGFEVAINWATPMYNEAIKDSQTYWNNILQELNK